MQFLYKQPSSKRVLKKKKKKGRITVAFWHFLNNTTEISPSPVSLFYISSDCTVSNRALALVSSVVLFSSLILFRIILFQNVIARLYERLAFPIPRCIY